MHITVFKPLFCRGSFMILRACILFTRMSILGLRCMPSSCISSSNYTTQLTSKVRTNDKDSRPQGRGHGCKTRRGKLTYHGFNPGWKNINQTGSSPEVGVKANHFWNRHLLVTSLKRSPLFKRKGYSPSFFEEILWGFWGRGCLGSIPGYTSRLQHGWSSERII